jgi:benzil reductase ((S)-benzoin forming)
MNTDPRHLTLLTGGSRGMGRSMARQLLGPQRLLLCIARHTDDDLAHAAMAQGAHLEQWAQDLTDTTEAAERLARWLDSLHPPSLLSATLINNAGVIPSIGPLEQCPLSELQQALRVGLEAPMALTSVFLRITQDWVTRGWNGPRKVLNISSGLGRRAMASQGPYCSAKAGMDHFSRCVALEQARHIDGARIVSLAPGVIDTDMQTQLRAGDPAAFPDVDRFRALKSGGQLTSAEDAARQVLAYLNRPDFGTQPVADVRD